jgi:hypothetical protein
MSVSGAESWQLPARASGLLVGVRSRRGQRGGGQGGVVDVTARPRQVVY